MCTKEKISNQMKIKTANQALENSWNRMKASQGRMKAQGGDGEVGGMNKSLPRLPCCGVMLGAKIRVGNKLKQQ